MEFALCRREESVLHLCCMAHRTDLRLWQSPICWPRCSTHAPRKNWRRVTMRRHLYHQRQSPRKSPWNVERSSRTRSWLWEGWPECSLCFGSSVRLYLGRGIDSTACKREESEKVSELKSVSGSSKLPYGTLASGTEGIREAINGFDDAWVFPGLPEPPSIY